MNDKLHFDAAILLIGWIGVTVAGGALWGWAGALLCVSAAGIVIALAPYNR